ncbi:transmembrane protein 138-domain-containing protein [Powellomyces hirtus]|nr:transmembrane protein 138-domain-containing protein [Powellomyces hirtus]
MRKIRSFRLTAVLQLCLLIADLLITLFAEYSRHTFVTVIVAYLIQGLLFLANVMLLFLRFTSSYPFRAGMLRIMINEFNAVLWASLIYAGAFILCRAIGLPLIAKCDNGRCDFWTDGYTVVYVLFRIAEVGYIYSFLRAMMQLCEPKYYKDSSWLREKLRQST